jgi:hypothetical protein
MHLTSRRVTVGCCAAQTQLLGKDQVWVGSADDASVVNYKVVLEVGKSVQPQLLQAVARETRDKIVVAYVNRVDISCDCAAVGCRPECTALLRKVEKAASMKGKSRNLQSNTADTQACICTKTIARERPTDWRDPGSTFRILNPDSDKAEEVLLSSIVTI